MRSRSAQVEPWKARQLGVTTPLTEAMDDVMERVSKLEAKSREHHLKIEALQSHVGYASILDALGGPPALEKARASWWVVSEQLPRWSIAPGGRKSDLDLATPAGAWVVAGYAAVSAASCGLLLVRKSASISWFIDTVLAGACLLTLGLAITALSSVLWWRRHRGGRP